MEGTPHERAALVGIAYFLGFLTTFIWLGFNTAGSTPMMIFTPNEQSASVVASLPSVPAQTPPVVEEVSLRANSATYVNGVLEVTALGETRALSFNPEISGLASAEEFVAQGVHYGELLYATSPSEEYIFFCEKKSVDAETCLPFVYDALTESIYPVRKDGDRVELLTGAAAAATWQGNQLAVGGEVSPDAAKPWLLGR